MRSQSEMPNQSVALWKLYLLYFVPVRLGNAGQRKTIAIMYSPEGCAYVDEGHSLKSFLR